MEISVGSSNEILGIIYMWYLLSFLSLNIYWSTKTIIQKDEFVWSVLYNSGLNKINIFISSYYVLIICHVLNIIQYSNISISINELFLILFVKVYYNHHYFVILKAPWRILPFNFSLVRDINKSQTKRQNKIAKSNCKIAQ